ncbi:MAG: hypothetical protein HYV29_13520 [Ignavibacteriales bacterium]|nr:hypothetical protein [Ignavibacteriales bacterium]
MFTLPRTFSSFSLVVIMIASTLYSQHKIDDPHSFANTDEIVVTHLDLDLSVNFDSKTLSGKATLDVENKKKTKKVSG